MVLRRSDFVDWKVNWKPKSENLRALAADLNLALESFIFLDDNPMECAEVASHCPTITVLAVPSEIEKDSVVFASRVDIRSSGYHRGR